MKKICSFLVAFLIAVAFSVTAFADEGAGISMESSSDGENSTVNVMISGKTNPEMIQFCMNYDPEKMECIGAFAGGVLNGNSAPVINVEDGKIYFVWDSLNPIEEDGILLQVQFKSIDASEDAKVSIEGGKKLIVAGKDFKNVAPEKVENLTVFEGTGASSESSKSESDKTDSGTQSSKPESKPSSDGKVEEGFNNGLTFTENQVTVQNGEKIELGVAEKDENLVWSSSNEDVIKVDENGNIETVGPGTATITVTDETGEKESTCVITVTDEKEVEVITNEKEESSGGIILAVVIGTIIIGAAALVLIKLKKR